jgi:26 proteasome complex subunit DSS1
MADDKAKKEDTVADRPEEGREKQDVAPVVDTDVLEEDDDFEEFEDDQWNEATPQPDDDLQWEDNWDDEEDDDDFAKRLRAELERADRENATAKAS